MTPASLAVSRSQATQKRIKATLAKKTPKAKTVEKPAAKKEAEPVGGTAS